MEIFFSSFRASGNPELKNWIPGLKIKDEKAHLKKGGLIF